MRCKTTRAAKRDGMESDTITCFDCGLANSTIHYFCAYCGTPLWPPEEPAAPSDLPTDAYELWKTATDKWQSALEMRDPDVILWGHIASLLMLAVSYAGSTPFPRAHAHLAIALLTLGMDAGAAREASIALAQNPNEFRAQQVRVALALSSEREAPSEHRVMDFGSFQHQVVGEADDVERATRTLIDADDVAAGESVPAYDLAEELERSIAIFKDFCEINTNVDEYLNVADFLILMGDEIEGMPLEDLRIELYRAVAHTPTNLLDYAGREHEVADVLKRARRGVLSFEFKQAEGLRKLQFA
jgi:hypothetical protein